MAGFTDSLSSNGLWSQQPKVFAVCTANPRLNLHFQDQPAANARVCQMLRTILTMVHVQVVSMTLEALQDAAPVPQNSALFNL